MMPPSGFIVGLWLMVWWPLGGEPQRAVIPAPPPEAHASAVGSHDHPESLLNLSDEALRERIASDLASLGSLTIGAPGSAILVNAVSLPPSPRWEVAPNADIWGTSETIAGIQIAVDKVHELFPDTQPLAIGDISDTDGGRLKGHSSHQAGRDADLGFYYASGKVNWFQPGTAANLDLARNWALVRALVTCTDVEVILLETRIQRLLYNYALSISEDKAWLDKVFQFSRGSRDAIVRYVPRHHTHYHVRFYNPVAQELGRRAFPFLVENKIVQPPVYTVSHVVRNGQTLGHLATRYGTSVRSIMQANGMSTTQLRAGRAYRIPVRAAAPPIEPLVLPLRLLPPQTPAVMASATWPTMLSLYADRLGVLGENPWALALTVPHF
jgi:murein endopeptidase/LysM repeat protein